MIRSGVLKLLRRRAEILKGCSGIVLPPHVIIELVDEVEMRRGSAVQRTHCKNGGHALTPENTYIVKMTGSGYQHRQCRACKSEYMKKYHKDKMVREYLRECSR